MNQTWGGKKKKLRKPRIRRVKIRFSKYHNREQRKGRKMPGTEALRSQASREKRVHKERDWGKVKYACPSRINLWGGKQEDEGRGNKHTGGTQDKRDRQFCYIDE